MDYVEEMDKFLAKNNFPKLNQEEIENLNRLPHQQGNWNNNQKSSSKQKPGPDGFTAEFYQKFREELTPILLKLFQKISDEHKLSNSFYEATIIPIPKPKMPQKIKLQAKITDEHRCKNP